MPKKLNDSTIATITSLVDTDYMNTVNPSTGEISKITVANVKASIGAGPLVYAAIFSQSSSSAPANDFTVANTTGKTFTWARTGAGTYTLTASGSFFTGATVVTLTPNLAVFGFVIFYVFTSSTVLTVYTKSFSDTFVDSALDHATIKLEKY